ncbi:hypothetical protein DCAR_0934096 [Daucus carota subsp. sativus]|uniref:Uncharacterized protein n=1 Tax=Daucus carota subsp. sativus TaxID=79200 RepID=A0A175YEB6_DAUCS|nr:PREDICTED: uncharacterized protein LOC108201228 [Daucus carota subsp. sativus]WOH14576.1 hypothetical protein DCAR_0934096 [Daucus carota subsp. sativus]
MKSILAAHAELSMPKQCHVRVRPKIRIIHVLEPRIIQTDVSNFREMVQRLTGKPTGTEMKRKARVWDSDWKIMEKERKVLYGQSAYGNQYFDGFLELDGLFEEEEKKFSAFP